ncbi:3-hydroxyisobutyryl-CoA hydrolase [Actinosynnema sp. ALI-1.44]|uniref:enoyl-CoA hydratase/isomerase family protein n=1 Tax=Actinosynnema sp. ALI-1.44 TaxID=1933779 RepID=UPI00097BD3EA|nr:enoyl-CoA hydratase/isomerase family protein [Actinosynnema sp. ALI-1.44]ONI82868.1 3-hydroxyisobutyryl-CoA hydrolase [Actinosynnema sp. ALI-1.44]
MTEVLVDVRDGLARITLNRPQAINALTHDMVRTIDAALTEWETDAGVRAVVITGAGDRGLCAGGDIRSIYEDARSGGTASLDFWADEYKLNAHITRYPKPYVAVMDGVVMGGGVGVSAHGSIRVVTERSRIAMPEVGIGLVPDVGGTYLLSRTPGQLGTHIALTAAQLNAGDAIHCGLADFYVPSARIPQMLELLAQREAGEAVRAVAELPADRPLSRQTDWIDTCYAAETVEEILDRLRASGEQGSSAAKEIESKSPTAVKVTLRALRSAATLPDLETVLAQEYRVSAACLRGHDLTEGIRAQIIDKDRNPRWSPGTLAEVTDDVVAAHFDEVR